MPDGITALVLDEAHGAEDVATSVLGDEVSLGTWGQLEKRLKTLTDDAITKADRVARRAGEDLPASANEWPGIATTWRMKAGEVAGPLLAWIDALQKRLAEGPRGARQTLLGDERPYTRLLLERAQRFSQEMGQGAPVWLDAPGRKPGSASPGRWPASPAPWPGSATPATWASPATPSRRARASSCTPSPSTWPRR